MTFIRTVILATFFFLGQPTSAQDSMYTRQVLKYLTSKKCFGRGYVKEGLQAAEKYLLRQIKDQLMPLFGESYTQSFYHNVNTFPSHCEVKINNKKLLPGINFIPDANSQGVCGKYKLVKIDSCTFTASEKPAVTVLLKKKLTYTVGKTSNGNCTIEVDNNLFKEEPSEIEINLTNNLRIDFESRNVGGYINGTSSSDSMIVFTAHYDHLGGIGKKTFFPGANDNASGVSFLLNLIKHYKSFPPRYKTVFVFFAGEEAGLLGSRYFVERKSIGLDKIKFLINLDLLGTGDDGIMVVNGAVYEKAFSTLTSINSKENLVKEVKKRGKAANSDHYWFSEAGVPCFFIYTMGGISAYHDVYDKEKTLPLSRYKQIFKLLTEFVLQL